MDAMDQANTTVAAEKTPGNALLERLPSARKAIACDTATHTFFDIDDPEGLRHAANDDTVHIWLDLSRPSAEEMGHLSERLHLHPLAVEDALTGHQRPKIEEYDGFFFLVFYALTQPDGASNGNAAVAGGASIESDGSVGTQELRVFVGKHYLLTVHDDPIPALDEAERRWKRNEQQAEWGAGILLYSLLDSIVDQYFPTLDALVERAEDLDERIFASRTRTRTFTYDLLALKRTFLELRRIISPERDVLNVLTNRDSPVFNQHTLVYFRDVYDHIARVSDTLDLYRDQLTSTMDASLAIASNDLNVVMRTLTSVTIILMSASLIAGIYGMNFVNIPELHWGFGYLYALLLMAAVSLALWYYFKRVHWL
ncbi:MAG TPA: magnesium/cobalt transporter CorA [Ktedonobacterales bacterium]|jgi:magnesium transporter